MEDQNWEDGLEFIDTEHFDPRPAHTNTTEKKSRKKKGGRKKRGGLILLIVLLLLGGLSAGGWFLYQDYSGRIRPRAIAEAGTEVTAADFLKRPGEDAYFVPGTPLPDPRTPGEQALTIHSGHYNYHCTLLIEDTVAPTAEAKNLSLLLGETAEPADFVENITDATDVSVSFAGDVDFHTPGHYSVGILLKDAGSNVTEVFSELTVSPLRPELTVEAGSPFLTAADFLLPGIEDGEFVTELSEDDLHRVRDIPVEIRVAGDVYTSLLHVTDTIPPTFTAQDYEGYASALEDPGMLVTSETDATMVTYSFDREPDADDPDPQTLSLIGRDEGGNASSVRVTLTLIKDTEPPVFTGVHDIVIHEGDTISYKQIPRATDNCDGEMEYTVDADGVNPSEEGEYTATYTATDRAGNTAIQTITVTVLHRDIDVEVVNAMADEVLERILTPEMTPMEIITKIYSYVYNNIGYENRGKTEDNADWVPAAYEGLKDHIGDCLTYASVSKVLLTRAGIENIDICKIPTSRKHFWNLVNIGEGWYHFDACRRSDHPYLCYVDDATLMAYSAEHHNSHMYVKEDYPDIE
ncbi:MAG: hypothetical protein K5891_08680 [Lachnospiraceae bacterium]|nr:hypothetical protein [Lachnospiraceae bacterium]